MCVRLQQTTPTYCLRSLFAFLNFAHIKIDFSSRQSPYEQSLWSDSKICSHEPFIVDGELSLHHTADIARRNRHIGYGENLSRVPHVCSWPNLGVHHVQLPWELNLGQVVANGRTAVLHKFAISRSNGFGLAEHSFSRCSGFLRNPKACWANSPQVRPPA